MSAGSAITPSEYIQHHLTFFAQPLGGGHSAGFWAINVDSVVMSIALGLLGLGLIWWVVRGATSGVPNRRQAFVELLIEFVDDQAKSVFHGADRHKFAAPTALTVFVWVVLMNTMDVIPVDYVTSTFGWLGFQEWRPVPTADVNTTFALSISVLFMSLYFAWTSKGFGGWLRELFTAPFGKKVFVWPANLLFNIVEYFSKTLSHSLRLFGNIYAGDILFLLLWMWAAQGATGSIAAVVLALGWSIFELLIILLQAYIFMMLTVVYISMAQQHH